jgi:ketosteroid isomerase-like protein
MAARDVQALRNAWDALARGDIDTATEVLDPDARS